MYTNILIPTDGSPLAEQAVDKGIALAKALGAKVTVLTVIEPFEVMRHFVVADSAQLNETYAMYEREADAHADRILGSKGFVSAWPSDTALNKGQRSDLQTALLRINVRESAVTEPLDLGLAMGAAQALAAIDARLGG